MESVIRCRRIAEKRHVPISSAQNRCIIEATIEPLRLYRAGFARSKAGPFYDYRTVQALLKVGALRIERQGIHVFRVTARAA